MSVAFKCPLCGFIYVPTPMPEIAGSKLDQVFGTGVLTATWRAQRTREIEEHLGEHLKTHTVTEWALAVTSLENALRFCHDIAEEEYPFSHGGNEVALRHIVRKSAEALERLKNG